MKNKYHKDVHYICKLPCKNKIEKIYGKLKNYDVILTEERIEHIIKRRKIDSIDILKNLKNAIINYDLMLSADSNCIRFVKFSNRGYSYIVKLSLDNSRDGNSIISGIIITNKKIKRLVLKNKIIDMKI